MDIYLDGYLFRRNSLLAWAVYGRKEAEPMRYLGIIAAGV
jgi:hypothetical protein